MFQDYFFVYSGHFDRDKGLDWGRLTLNSLSKGCQSVWIATSSYSSKQVAEAFHDKGGMIPPCYRSNANPYTVDLIPLNLNHIKGIEGNFYKINPHFVITDQGGKRGDFGIHKDANAPGSLGCIVMSAERFADFEIKMSELRRQQAKSIPLFVQYS